MSVTVKDQLNNTITLSSYPKKIISLVPSQTELLFDLGLDKEVTGITKFCIHPQEWFRTKQRIGGPKTVNISLVKSLQPDLIIANKEENVKDQIEELQKSFPVYVSDVDTLSAAIQMIETIGILSNKAAKAKDITEKIKTEFKQLPKLIKNKRTAYLIWKDPYMSAGGDTFISNMLAACGFDNVFKTADRYPVFTIDELKHLQCDLILLSSEPFPFKENHIEELKQQMPDTSVLLADGEMFSWYGSRMMHAPKYFSKLITKIEGLAS